MLSFLLCLQAGQCLSLPIFVEDELCLQELLTTLSSWTTIMVRRERDKHLLGQIPGRPLWSLPLHSTFAGDYFPYEGCRAGINAQKCLPAILTDG